MAAEPSPLPDPLGTGERQPEPRSTPPQWAIPCPHCNAWWTGLSAGHCTACHRTFTSIAAFDKHRRGSHAHATRHCIQPADAGLVPANKRWTGWTLPKKAAQC